MGTTPNGSHKLHTKSHHLNITPSQPLNTNLTTSPSHHLTIKSHHLNISTSQHNKKWYIFYI